MSARRPNAAAGLASMGHGRQPGPKTPGMERCSMGGVHVSGHIFAPRHQMEAWEVAMESLHHDGSNGRVGAPKIDFWRARKVHFWRQHLGHTQGAGSGSHATGSSWRKTRAVGHGANAVDAGQRTAHIAQ